MIDGRHPYWSVRASVGQRAEVAGFHFSYYTYRAQSLVDRRTNRAVSVSEFNDPDFVQGLLNSCPENQDLAFHGLISMRDGSSGYLPLVDMATPKFSKVERFQEVLKRLDSALGAQLTWFSSGRSFHGYGGALITEREWRKFMGLLLLVNRPSTEPWVDPRWIGHRLIAGYGALRWSNNSAHYLSEPAALGYE